MYHKKYAFYLTIGALLAFGLLVAAVIQNPFEAFDSTEPLRVAIDKGTQKPIKVVQEVIGQSGSVIYVDCQGGSDTNDGSFWNLAKKTLANAIESASGPTDIFLKANDSCYYPGFITITKPDLIISGGYTGNLQSPQERYEDKNSVISANNSGYVLKAQNATGSLVLDRLVIKNGNAPVFFGGGLGILNSPQYRVTVQNCLFENNVASRGGGIYVGGIQLFKVLNSTFRNNTAQQFGGAISVNNSHVIINNNFINNTAVNGGALSIESGSYQTDITSGNNFFSNSATGTSVAQGGGAIYAKTTNAPIVSNFFKENQANYGSAIISTGGNASAYIANNILIYNRANYGTIYVGTGQSFNKAYSNTFAYNTASVSGAPTTLMVGEGVKSFTLQNSVIVDYDLTRPLIGKDSNPDSSFVYNYLNIFPTRTNEQISNPPQQVYTKVSTEPKFLTTNFSDDPFSYEFTPDYDARDYGYQNNSYLEFRGCPRDVKSKSSTQQIYPDMSAFEYQNVEQYATLENWKGPQNNGDQSVIKLTITVKDASGSVILSPTARPMSSNGYYTIPTRYGGIPAGTNVKTIIKAPGYLAAAVSGALPACNSPGANVQLIMGDVDGNNQIDLRDISEILVNFAKTGALGSLPQDLNGNGVVDINDLNATLTNFAKIGAN